MESARKLWSCAAFETVYAQEKASTYQDTVVPPAGRPDAVELLRPGTVHLHRGTGHRQ
ncbi:MAG: hypothetical protein ACLR1T_03595 [Evtepia gabavorous]